MTLYLFLSQFCPLKQLMMTPQHILAILRPLEHPPIEIWSSNSLEINILKLDSRGFMMLPLMDGEQRISIDNAIRRDGLWLSLKQLRISSLAASQQLIGNRYPHSHLSISPACTRFCSVWMRAANTLSPAEMKRLLDVGVVTVQGLGEEGMS